MRKFKRITSIILATLMVMSLFAAVPMTVNAAPPDSGSGSGPGGTGTVITPTTAGDDYLTFTAEEAGSSVTLNVSTGSNLQYSLDGGELIPYTPGAQITLASAGDYVRFSGTGTTFNSSNHVSLTGRVACSGNVMSLRLDNNGEVQGLSDSCFSNMFKGCAGLTAAPELPETTLARDCYSYMFSGCTSLTTAPELPATSLAPNCYSNMFYGCGSLTTAPELPATSLAESCYNNMFSRCGRLTTAPELPATSLARYCYNNMFARCTNLTTAPELWATTLEPNCYYNMFSGCENLTTAPELPATELAYSCYSYMFNGCTSLTTAPVLPATTLMPYCYSAMFAGCSSIKLSETKTAEYSIPYSVPYGGDGTTASSALDYMFDDTGGTFTGTPELNKTYYLYREVPNYDYTTTGGEGFFFDDAVEVGLDDALADKNNYTSLCNFKLLGVQKKVESDELDSESKTDVRFVSVVNTDILRDADEYGYIFAKAGSKDEARDNVDKIVSSNAKVLTVPCTESSNTISGDYGKYDANTDYKYVTASVNGIGDSTVAARFYVKKGDNYYYADYTNKDNETYTVCATAFSDLG